MPEISYVKRLVKETETGPAGRRFYSKNLKKLIVELITSGKESKNTLSKKIGINPNVMGKWVKHADKKQDCNLKPVKIVREHAAERKAAPKIVLEKVNGTKIHLSGISSNSLIELVRHI